MGARRDRSGTRPAGGSRPPTPAPRRGRRRLLPYLLLLPGAAWLLLFFVVPPCQLAAASLYDPTGSLATGYAMTWAVQQLLRRAQRVLAALRCARSATPRSPLVLALLLGYPLAYAIAQKAGRWKNLLLVCVVAPFFTSFLVRTLAWKTILSDNGPVVVGLLRWLHLLGPDGRLLATPPAVVLGLTYNFLPFMVLPLYASLEQLDRRLLEAASDLYAQPGARRSGGSPCRCPCPAWSPARC